ncbi:LysE family translocator [Bowmanella yangjiangensis]|uniref:LysE family translocator n=1 Tax=Bowmanella yangjiangensis TaxID=2811230 RepID=A0ABS3CRQ0_9ALTE|nr:LysE family translocator [Bowmanella yangjiangensis]MBN7818334.1 LysE family translocator [Bowmanella yangjiangensis]
MTLTQMMILFSSMLLLAALPSASVALVVSRSASHGVRQGMMVALGIVSADLLFAGLAIVGMSALAHWLGELFTLIRLIAACYLIWLGWQLLRQTRREQPSSVRKSVWGSSYLSGLLLTLADVKAIVFYASLFPSVVDLQVFTSVDFICLFLLTLSAVGGVKLLYAWLGSSLAVRLGGKRLGLVWQRITGGLMVGGGLYLLVRQSS